MMGICPICRRHSRGVCPFCSRAAAFVIVASSPFDCNTPAPAYGGPPVPPPTVTATAPATPAVDSGTSAASDSGVEDTGVRLAAPAYGLAPPRITKDAGTERLSVPAYGLPPNPTVNIGPIEKPK